MEPPPRELALNSPEHYIWTFMESLKPHVRAIMQNILSHPVVGLVLDIFTMSMVVVVVVVVVVVTEFATVPR